MLDENGIKSIKHITYSDDNTEILSVTFTDGTIGVPLGSFSKAQPRKFEKECRRLRRHFRPKRAKCAKK